MKIGIKYCGGCNPLFDRKKFAMRLMDDFKDLEFEPVGQDIKYDMILVINGCTRECAAHEELNADKKIIVNSDTDFDSIKKKIENYKKKSS